MPTASCQSASARSSSPRSRCSAASAESTDATPRCAVVRRAALPAVAEQPRRAEHLAETAERAVELPHAGERVPEAVEHREARRDLLVGQHLQPPLVELRRALRFARRAGAVGRGEVEARRAGGVAGELAVARGLREAGALVAAAPLEDPLREEPVPARRALPRHVRVDELALGALLEEVLLLLGKRRLRVAADEVARAQLLERAVDRLRLVDPEPVA